MAEKFSCEFCKAEFKKVSGLQRHMNTNKKCISNREESKCEIHPNKTQRITEIEPDTNEEPQNNTLKEQGELKILRYIKALKKKLREKEEELAFKEGIIRYYKGIRDQPVNIKKDAVYEVNMFCMCGMLAYMRETNMVDLLDETIVEEFKVNPDKFERTITVTITKKDSSNNIENDETSQK